MIKSYYIKRYDRDDDGELTVHSDPDNIANLPVLLTLGNDDSWLTDEDIDALVAALTAHRKDEPDAYEVNVLPDGLTERIESVEARLADLAEQLSEDFEVTDEIAESVDTLNERIEALELASAEEPEFSNPEGTLLSRSAWNEAAWAHAAGTGKAVSFTYRKPLSAADEVRQVRPSERPKDGLLVGVDQIAGDIRAFRADRVQSYVVVTG